MNQPLVVLLLSECSDMGETGIVGVPLWVEPECDGIRIACGCGGCCCCCCCPCEERWEESEECRGGDVEEMLPRLARVFRAGPPCVEGGSPRLARADPVWSRERERERPGTELGLGEWCDRLKESIWCW